MSTSLPQRDLVWGNVSDLYVFADEILGECAAKPTCSFDSDPHNCA